MKVSKHFNLETFILLTSYFFLLFTLYNFFHRDLIRSAHQKHCR